MSMITDSLGMTVMRCSAAAIALLLTGFAAASPAPMAWSPDGSWIAYTVEVRPAEQVAAPGRLFKSVLSLPKPATIPVVGYRLWLTQAATQSSILLEDSVGPLTAPGWSPDHHQLAFGRVVSILGQPGRFEVVVVDGLTKRRVVLSQPLPAAGVEAGRLTSQAIAWSADGRYLAIPQLEPMGLLILRADNGRILNFIADACLPAWSPSGGRLAFLVRTGSHSLQYLESPTGQPHHLVDVGPSTQAPLWTRDGMSLFAMAHRTGSTRLPDVGEPQELLRVQLRGENFTVEPVLRPISAALVPNRERQVEGVSVAVDRDAENVFCSAIVSGEPHQITWFHPRENAVQKRFPLVDQTVPMGSLAITPVGKMLAARTATSDHLAYPVLCNLELPDLRTRLVAPDDDARLEWIASLTQVARAMLAKLPAPTTKASSGMSRPAKRPTILPISADHAADPELEFRLRQIGQLGRPLCDRPPGRREPDPATGKVFDEARLFFDYLREDYGAALTMLALLEPDAATPDQSVELMTIRAQIQLNQGQFTAAKRIIQYLDGIDQQSTRRCEWTGAGYILTESIRPDQGWPRHLLEVVDKAQATTADPKSADGPVDPPPGPVPPLFQQPVPFRPAQILPPPDDDPPNLQRLPNRNRRSPKILSPEINQGAIKKR